MSGKAQLRRDRVLRALGVLALLVGGWASFRAAERGRLDYAYLHLSGLAVMSGTNVYASAGKAALATRHGLAVPENRMFYPPATGFAMLPFAVLPFSLGRTVWFLSMSLALVLGTRALVRLVMQAGGERVWMLAAGLVLASSAVRWGMILLQGAPLLLGLLCLFVVALHARRPGWALAIAVYATAFKMTLALPFIGLLLLHRRFAAAGIAVTAWLGLNTAGFAWMGDGAFASYQSNVAALQAVNDPTNIDSPDPWLPVARPRIDWISLFYGISRDLPISRLLSLLLSAGVALWLLREGIRSTGQPSLRTSAAFLGPLACLGSLCVYHHHYDVSLCLVPALLLALLWDRRATWGHALWLPLTLVMLFWPIGLAQDLARRVAGPSGAPLLKLLFPVLVSLALGGSLLMLKQHRESQATSR